MQLDGRHRFDNYVVGSANRLAATAARAVAESPGATYNPLIIYGATGLGKTHLLGAIATHATALEPGLHVDALTLDEFVRQLHAAVSVGQADAFRERYAHVDLLLIDDIQFLTGRRETQSEMLRLCQSLQEAGRQIVMTSDRPPTEIADVDERLVARLAGGLVVDIGNPDYETRAAMLATWCEERGVRSGAGAIEALARLELRNIRELQGAFTRVIAYQGLGIGSRAIEVADVRRLFADHPELLSPAGAASLTEAGAASSTSPRGEFLSFLDDVASAVAEHVEPWRAKLAEAAATPPAGPSAEFTRRAFEIGSSNELAVRAADAVVSDPGHRFNPLFIHGPSGVGKTHLAHAIGNALAAAAPGKTIVACIGAQAFIDELIGALREGQVDQWRARYRCANALVIDDVHFMAGKERTQEELFHVFNDLYSAGKQIVLTSDRPPAALSELEARLRSRFAGGLVTEIQAPDTSLRKKLFAHYLLATSAERDIGLANYLAEVQVANAREILGIVNRLSAAADVAGVRLTLDFARAQLEGPGAAHAAPPEVAAVGAEVDPYFLDGERVVWEWPDATGRVIEEWR